MAGIHSRNRNFLFLAQGPERDVREAAGEPDPVAGGVAHGQQPPQGRRPHGLRRIFQIPIQLCFQFSSTLSVVKCFNTNGYSCRF